MQGWFPDLGNTPAPKYRAIAEALTAAIRAGTLRPGERLPPQRDLARELHVDLTTVTRAYGIVRDAGLIEAGGRLGSYVRNTADFAAGFASDDTGMNMPPQPGFALLGEAIRTGTAALLRAAGPSPLLQYKPSQGGTHDRIAAAEALTEREVPAREEEMLIAAGGQHALHAIFGTVFAPGDTVCTGRYIYPGMRALAARFGLRLRVVESDAGGLDPDALARAAPGAAVLYIVSTNDNPTTATLDLSRRAAIAEIARRHGLTIVEDDAYGLLPAAPLPPIASLAPERVWHIGSVAKIISPALRVAHVRAPSAEAATRLAADLHETAVMAPPLNAALVSLWLRDGSFDRLVAAVRAEAMARARIVARHLAGHAHAMQPEGYHLWLPLGASADADALAAAMRPFGLSAVPGSAFAAMPGESANALRISTGGAIDHDRLRRALEQLAELLA